MSPLADAMSLVNDERGRPGRDQVFARLVVRELFRGDEYECDRTVPEPIEHRVSFRIGERGVDFGRASDVEPVDRVHLVLLQAIRGDTTIVNPSRMIPAIW